MRMASKVLQLLIMFVWRSVAAASPPQIEPMKQLDNVKMGQRVTLLCALKEGTVPITFAWQVNGAALRQTENVKVVYNDDYQQTLQITSVGLENIGNYTCSARNSFGSDQMTVAVVPKHKPMWLTPDVKSVSGVAGGGVTLDCSAIGQPLPIVSIFKEGMVL